MTRNRTKAIAQNFIKVIINDFFVFGQEKILDFDNSMNSFVGCCSRGTGHLGSFISVNYGNIRLYLGWNHIFKRLNSERVEYEESGWYDGKVWIKPLVLKEKESLIASNEVKPILKNLIQILSLISALGLSGILLFQNNNF